MTQAVDLNPLEIRPDQDPIDLLTCLWVKPSKGKAVELQIPDTIVIDHGQFQQWYFTSKYGEILRRRRDKLTKERVFQFFQERLTAGIAAVFVHAVPTEKENVLYIEHLTLPALESLMYRISTIQSGMLQAFIPPKSRYNSMIQTIYAYEGCHFQVTKATNLHMIINNVVPLSERSGTFEGTSVYTSQKSITNPTLVAQFKHINEQIIQHTNNAIGLLTTRITLYFKVGADDRIYFLYPSTVVYQNVDGATPCSLTIHPGVLVTLTPSPEVGQRRRKCPSCLRLDESGDCVKFLVTYKSIVAAHIANTSNDDNLHHRIPPIIRGANSSLSFEKYQKSLKTASFQYKTIEVCEDCCRSINSTSQLHEKDVPKTPKKKCVRLSIVDRVMQLRGPKNDNKTLNQSNITPVVPSTTCCILQTTRPASAVILSKRKPLVGLPIPPTKPKDQSSGPTISIKTKQRPVSAAATTLRQTQFPFIQKPIVSIQESLEKLRNKVMSVSYDQVPSIQSLLSEHDLTTYHNILHINYLSTLCDTLQVPMLPEEWKAIAMYCEPHTDSSLVDLDVLDELICRPRAPQPPKPRPQSSKCIEKPPDYNALRDMGYFSGRRLISNQITKEEPQPTPVAPVVPNELTDEERLWLDSILTH
ncbi:hypothetical protein THRCLA_05527 [Thraustotheca clavata]|uniref:Uncharacterized protein n=1 Tax=Thraustotheca clavata TaxID=74557 RepID=A0A1V9ZVQ1_9STRA|nr:hypothetical protein THRCLA_05527 [Thraustotheca clavata]